MPAQFFVSGPPLLYAGVGAGRAPLFLGTPESEVNIQIMGSKRPVINALGGSSLPLDELWDGEIALVSFVLNRFNHAVAEGMMSQPNAGGIPGLNAVADMGTLLIQEGVAYPFWIVAPYAAKAAYSTMRPGYRFFACTLEAPKGTSFRVADKPFHFVVKALRAPVFTAGVMTGLALYDGNVSGLPAAS